MGPFGLLLMGLCGPGCVLGLAYYFFWHHTMVVIFSLPDVNSIIFLLDFTNYCLSEALEDNGSLVWVDLRCYGAAFPFLSMVKILKI
jgi:hypothetical protein